MRSIQFRAHPARSGTLIIAILGDLLVLFTYSQSDSISLAGLILTLFFINPIFLGAAYATMYWISIEGDQMIVKHAINDAFLRSYDLKKLSRVQLKHVGGIGMKIFLYEKEKCIEGFNINTLTRSDLRLLEDVLEEFKLIKR